MSLHAGHKSRFHVTTHSMWEGEEAIKTEKVDGKDLPIEGEDIDKVIWCFLTRWRGRRRRGNKQICGRASCLLRLSDSRGQQLCLVLSYSTIR